MPALSNMCTVTTFALPGKGEGPLNFDYVQDPLCYA